MDLSHWQAFIIAFLATIPAILGGVSGMIYALRKIQDVHQIVNQQRTDMMLEIKVLQEEVAALKLERTLHDRK